MENLESNLGRGPVYGSLAYDLHHPELYADEEFYSSSSAPEPEVKTEAEEQAAPKPRATRAAGEAGDLPLRHRRDAGRRVPDGQRHFRPGGAGGRLR